MASETVLELTDDNFDVQVNSSDLPVLVDFWAEWCMPCRMLTPIIDQIADEYDGKAKVGKLDTDANRQTAATFGIQAIPTVILFRAGQAVKTWQGVHKKEEFTAELDAVLA